MQEIEMSAEDLQRSYQGTFLGYMQEDYITPVKVIGADSHQGRRVLVCESRGDEPWTINYKDENLVYDYPDLGNVLLDGEVYWLERLPKRQWHRGIKPSLLQVQRLGGSPRTLDRVPEFWRILEKVYNPEYSSSVSKYACIKDGVYWYKGLRVCSQDELQDLQLKYFRDNEP